MPWCVPAPQAVHGIALFFRFMLLSSSSASSVLSSLPSSRQGSFRGITPRLVSRNMGVSNWLRTNGLATSQAAHASPTAPSSRRLCLICTKRVLFMHRVVVPDYRVLGSIFVCESTILCADQGLPVPRHTFVQFSTFAVQTQQFCVDFTRSRRPGVRLPEVTLVSNANNGLKAAVLLHNGSRVRETDSVTNQCWPSPANAGKRLSEKLCAVASWHKHTTAHQRRIHPRA
jgi:hypothetical protein